VSIRHPSVFRLIQVFQEFESANERSIAQLALSAPPKRKKAKYVAVNEALQRLALNIFTVGLPSLAPGNELCRRSGPWCIIVGFEALGPSDYD
jgi:hypothetical protein